MKKNYYTPEVKFHQLLAKSLILTSEVGRANDNDDTEAKVFSSISFDEDEE